MRPLIGELPASKIREVANAALGRSDVLAFWFGESDEPTPPFIREAAVRSIADGETFYSHNLGLPELRESIAAYLGSLHPPVAAERIAVTSSGVSALMLAMQALVGAGDEVVAVVPVWPNLTAQPAILGARVTRVALRPDRDGAWRLDLAALMAAVTADTRVLLVNSPNNPTGWTLTREEQQALLSHCRATGTWIVADEVYQRVFFDPARGSARCGSAELPRPRDAGRPARRRPELLEELSHDRLAARLAGAAGGHRAVACQADRVQHLVRAGVRAARRPGRAGAGFDFRAEPDRATEGGPRRLAASPGRHRRRRGGDPAGRPVRLLSRARQRRFARLRQAAGRARRASASRPAPRSGPKAKAGCAGASRRTILAGSRPASSVSRRHLAL